MADATATALRGQVRSQRRAGTMSRACWRLVVLLGLAWGAVLLLGGTAQAAPAAEHHRAGGHDARPHAVPLLGQVLSTVDKVTHPRAKADKIAHPHMTATPAATKPAATPKLVGAKITAPSTHATQPTLPAAQLLGTVSAIANDVRDTAEATASSDSLLDVRIPTTSDIVTPTITAVTDQVDATVQTVADAATLLTVRLPLTRPVAGLLETAAGAVDLTTDHVVAATASVTASVDTAVRRTTQAIAPVLHAVSGPIGSIVISAPGAGPSAGAAPVSPGAPATDASATIPTRTTVDVPAARHLDRLGSGATLGGPAVPPPDATPTHVVAQPAADIVTSLAVPMSGAGSTTGNGGSSAPAPSLDKTLVRVDESEPVFEDEAVEPIEGPTGPMPGTPSADPSFSPD
ncbi:hypothetical protein [Nocardioides jejuensis]|uniref:Uncharacterized protein n=1 Tax=Nocardioides jejuensis TaxID=2502782 RepID=A0A4R1CIQ4_9ACTN|nr:hypothetical protein [Nocardioides jejuensis]TCJ29838.1 hypothetical protein EPD65_05895 [Nocardioides jejuensis]